MTVARPEDDRERPAGVVRAGVRAALRDVAAAANVHPSTASRALNPGTQGRVNAATVARVLEAASRVGYEPNSLARGLRTNRTFTVGMLIPDLTNPLFPPIVKGIEDRLSQDGYTLVLANTNYDLEREGVIVRAMVARQVDGLLLATARREYPLVQSLLDAGVKVVLVNRTMEHSPVPSVTGDEHVGIGLAVSHLASLGHRDIAYVGGDADASTGLGRYEAFVDRLRVEGLPLDPDLVAHADRFHEEPGAAAFAELLDRGKPFTAVVAANDRLALGCYEVLRERGLRIPQDVSVVGYNDILFADKFAPPLTTVRIPHYQIGVKAAQLLLEALNDGDSPAMSVRLSPAFVVRESTAAPRSSR
ncbi:MAG: LacI family DNA-binding transcriptional regulator [Gaiellaceae bacterium]